MAAAPPPPPSGDDDFGMGEQRLSLEGFFALNPALPEADRIAARAAARIELEAAIAEEETYWERISSAVLSDEVGDLSGVKAEYRDFARHWRKAGRGLNLIQDFKAHIDLTQQRFDRKQAKKDVRAIRQAKLDALKKSREAAAAAAATTAAAPATVAVKAAKVVQPPAPLPTDMFIDVDLTPSYDPNALLKVIADIEAAAGADPPDGIYAAGGVPEVSGPAQRALVQAYDHMMQCLKSPATKKRYGFNLTDYKAKPLAFGGAVPSYFANVTDQSIYRRKELTLAGLRNLLMYGAIIYCQLRDAHFSGDLTFHPEGTGLSLMRHVTGNVVDLDTVVLRCDRVTVNAINASNQHKKESFPVYATPEAFGDSPQAQDIAKHCAIPLLMEFAKACKFTTPAEIQKRAIDPAAIATPIYMSTSNTDRGKHPVWRYKNAGQNSYHVNVPSIDDVNGALIKAPLHCLRHWLTIHAVYRPGPDLDKWRESFFEDCVVDSCFNMKWKAIEEFGHKLAHHGSIVDVLQRLQAEHQEIFTVAFFDADNEEQAAEKREMAALAVGKIAREAKSHKLRAITAADVSAWVDDPAVVL